MVPAGHQRRRSEVLPRPPRPGRPGEQRAPADRPGREHPGPLGPRGWILRDRGGRSQLGGRAALAAGDAASLLQQPGLVQHRRAGSRPAGLGLLHQLRPGHDGVDPRAGQDRGHALQVRLRDRDQSLRPPLIEGEAGRRRHGFGPGVVHAWLRQLRRLDQVRRHHPPSSQDGDPQRGSPGHPGLRPLQGR